MKAKVLAAGVAAGVAAWGGAHYARDSGSPEAKAVLNDIEKWTARAEVASGDLSRQARSGLKEMPGFLQPAPPAAPQLARYEKELCDLANRERVRRGLPALKILPALALVARDHSREMADKKYFSHTSPTPRLKTPLLRFEARFKSTPRLVAENIYKLESSGFYRLGPRDFARAHTGWMNSPGHRANILRTSPAGGPTHIGVGIVVRDGSFWATQNFARLR